MVRDFGSFKEKVERVGFEQLLSFNSCLFRWVKKIILESAAVELRSWVQIPPGPFLSARELRYYFEFDLDDCRTKTLTYANAVSYRLSDILSDKS
jgi:hypothetical protein